ncbi:flavin reductase family protein [Brassicibacter mesophilus]|uniref:flavin reductase family protein n=1 Tax=Brassicibacter mesophilus TaxID=745119 RepID=UPI003D1A949C
MDIKFNELSKEMLQQLKKGIFLTVKNGNELNTMTIGWGSIGIMWNKPILMVPVRYSRYTYGLIDQSKDFTVSVPLKGDMVSELAYCGTKSGRNVDKLKQLGLTIVEAKKVNTPIIGECQLHFECKIVYKQAMDPKMLDSEIKDVNYANDNFHVLYYGEIVSCYLTN